MLESLGIRYPLTILLLFLFLLLALTIGTISIPPLEVVHILFSRLTGEAADAATSGLLGDVVWYLRLPRFLTAGLAGAGLAVAGAVLKAVVRNPLADPYILGVSSGAGAGVTAAVALGLTHFLGKDSLGFFAFLGALAAALFIMTLSMRRSGSGSFHLVMTGMAVNILCSALISLFVAIGASQSEIQTITYWLMGSIVSVTWEDVTALAISLLVSLAVFSSQERIINMMFLPDAEARTLGVAIPVWRRIYLIFTAVLVGLIVCHTGLIGFVGLIVPHIVERIFGRGRAYILLCAAFGALALVWADVLSRLLVPGMDIPIGVISALFGGPVFLGLLASRRYGFRGRG